MRGFSILLPRRTKIASLFTRAQGVPSRESQHNPVASELLTLAEIRRMQDRNAEWVAEHHPALYLNGGKDA